MEVLPTGDGIPTVAWMETDSSSDVRARVEPEQKVPGGKSHPDEGWLNFFRQKPDALGQFAVDKGRTDWRTHHEQYNTSHPGSPGSSRPPPLEQQRDMVVPLHGSPAGLHEAAGACVARNTVSGSSPKAEGSGPAERDGGMSKNMLDWGGTFSFPPFQA